MCGVIGLIYEQCRSDLGRIAADLLTTLEYRGYDSTGAAIQGEGEDVCLRKGVGAPSALVQKLGITDLSGRVFCGQVRWATFGAVNDQNAQPHVVRCKTYLYGAHNGNVTNCDELQAWLRQEGHAVASDNDGEMVVHSVEHFLERELRAFSPEQQRDREVRRRCMRRAMAAAAARIRGSFAAVLVDPVARILWAIKLGSSLYFGQGRDASGGRFAVASSDLSSVLKLTRVLVPLSEGELVEYEPGHYQVFAVDRAKQTVTPLQREPVRSRLRAEDTALAPPFQTFMEQEIAAQEQTVRTLVSLLAAGSDAARALGPALQACPAEAAWVEKSLDALREGSSEEALQESFHDLADHPAFRRLLAAVSPEVARAGVDGDDVELARRLISSDAALFADLLPHCRDANDRLAVRLLDTLVERSEQRELSHAADRFAELCAEALGRGRRVYLVCCGSSFHAAKAAAVFFNDIARSEITPLLPGEFRAERSRCVQDGDVLVAVSQSGETKDVIDVVNDVIASGKAVARIAVVNNVNSTLAQEKSHLVLPLRCGPEIAVPATKSFMSQLTLFYVLALKVAFRRLEDRALLPGEREEMRRALDERWERLPRLAALLKATVQSTERPIETAAQMLYLRPSLHVLATRMAAVAKEGALKVREVVLNHAEGFECSEFKHGPNTLLGFNTVFGPEQVQALLSGLGRRLEDLVRQGQPLDLPAADLGKLLRAAAEAGWAGAAAACPLPSSLSARLESALPKGSLPALLRADYPLIYVTGPDERDVALTISAVNTHKIRGASTVVIAEEHPALRAAASRAPADNPRYRSVYIPLPRTDDPLMVAFTATVVLQRLALRMSLLKQAYLDRAGIPDHGVHPDVPKNVSKSITVD